MIDQKLIERINYLANKSKREGLSEEEKTEQANLRQEYLRLFKEGFRQRLDAIKIVKEQNKDENN
jgi:uncharacterized protein YnzC (UPF0291/DUF896 family)